MLTSTTEAVVKAAGALLLGGVAIVAAGRWVERQLDSRLAVLRADHQALGEEAPGIRAAVRENFEMGLVLGRQVPADEPAPEDEGEPDRPDR
jgi:hypothetical protein